MERAIEECIRKNILRDFLEKNRAEAKAVSIYEYNEEEHIRMEREEAFEDGRRKGKEEERLNTERERQRAEEALKRVDEERQRADEERQRAEEERQRAEEVLKRVDEEQQRAEAAEEELKRLRAEMGLCNNTGYVWR